MSDNDQSSAALKGASGQEARRNGSTRCTGAIQTSQLIVLSCSECFVLSRGGEKCSLPRQLQMLGRSDLSLSVAMAEKVLTQGQFRSSMLLFRSAHFSPALSTAQRRSHSSVHSEPARRGCGTRGATRAQAGKGFGKSQEAQVTGARR